MPFTTVVAGTVITASWGNLNVRNQVVTPFASAAARTTAVGALAVEGMTSWLEDYDDLWIYDSANYKAIAGPPTAYKTADEIVNNNAAFQNDNHLAVPVAPNAYYRGFLNLAFTANAAAGFKVIFTGPVGATMRCSSFLVNTGGVLVFGTTNAMGSVAGISANGTQLPYQCKFMLTTTNAGILQLQWAQNTAHASDCTVHDGSSLELYRVA